MAQSEVVADPEIRLHLEDAVSVEADQRREVAAANVPGQEGLCSYR
jgi:hypothetical protein